MVVYQVVKKSFIEANSKKDDTDGQIAFLNASDCLYFSSSTEPLSVTFDLFIYLYFQLIFAVNQTVIDYGYRNTVVVNNYNCLTFQDLEEQLVMQEHPAHRNWVERTPTRFKS